MAELITLDEIAKAYEWCEIQPIERIPMYPVRNPTCGCPMFALACCRMQIKPSEYPRTKSLTEALGLSQEQFRAFTDEFDGRKTNSTTEPMWRTLGAAARERFHPVRRPESIWSNP